MKIAIVALHGNFGKRSRIVAELLSAQGHEVKFLEAGYHGVQLINVVIDECSRFGETGTIIREQFLKQSMPVQRKGKGPRNRWGSLK